MAAFASDFKPSIDRMRRLMRVACHFKRVLPHFVWFIRC